MFRVTFRRERYNEDLATVFTYSIPAVGESVYLYEQADRPATAKSYKVVSRHWHIMRKDSDESSVVILVTPDS